MHVAYNSLLISVILLLYHSFVPLSALSSSSFSTSWNNYVLRDMVQNVHGPVGKMERTAVLPPLRQWMETPLPLFESHISPSQTPLDFLFTATISTSIEHVQDLHNIHAVAARQTPGGREVQSSRYIIGFTGADRPSVSYRKINRTSSSIVRSATCSWTCGDQASGTERRPFSGSPASSARGFTIAGAWLLTGRSTKASRSRTIDDEACYRRRWSVLSYANIALVCSLSAMPSFVS